MNVFLLDSLNETVLGQLLDDNVSYRPDLLLRKPSILGRTLAQRADAIVTRAEVPPEALKLWHAARSPTYSVHVIVGDAPPTPSRVADDRQADVHLVLDAYGASEALAYVAAFAVLERESTRRTFCQVVSPAATATRHPRDQRVVMVGAGLVNLITAHAVQQAGYKVHLVDCGPDPRESSAWTDYGCSRGGDDARMFSLSEMNNHHDKTVSTTANGQFHRRVTEQGWNVYRQGSLSRDEVRWAEEFESLPTWLAYQYGEDNFGFNRESLLAWNQWKRDDPELFAASHLCEGIVRLFSDRRDFDSKAAIQSRLGACRRLLTPEDVAIEYPMLSDAVHSGLIAGGIDEVGFTIMAHQFMHQLVTRLTHGGATFAWNQSAHSLVLDHTGRVAAIQVNDERLEAGHFVISPGAYGNTLLVGTRSFGAIHGVLGVWLRLPNTDPQLSHSLKLRRKGHITDAANITIATDVTGAPILILGSGYGYTGIDPHNIDRVLLDQMYAGIVDTAEKYFPSAYRAALATGGLADTLKYCVRPWTTTGLGIFEMLATAAGGKCVITGGHNTGGFAQAPAIARAVLAALEGREHDMHYLYHPARASAYRAATRSSDV